MEHDDSSARSNDSRMICFLIGRTVNPNFVAKVVNSNYFCNNEIRTAHKNYILEEGGVSGGTVGVAYRVIHFSP